MGWFAESRRLNPDGEPEEWSRIGNEPYASQEKAKAACRKVLLYNQADRHRLEFRTVA